MNEKQKEIINKLTELRNTNIVAIEEITKIVKKTDEYNFLDRIMNSNCLQKTVKPHTTEHNQGMIYLPKQWIGKKIRVEEVR